MEGKGEGAQVEGTSRSIPGVPLLPHLYREQKRKLAETIEPVEPPSIAAQPPVMLADYITSMQAKSFSKMSGIELADVQIPGEYYPPSPAGAV